MGQGLAMLVPMLFFACVAALVLTARTFIKTNEYARTLDPRRKAAVQSLSLSSVDWTFAGRVMLDDEGEPRIPDLPRRPGLRRLEFVGTMPGQRSITMTETADLGASLIGPGVRFALDDMRAHLTARGEIEVLYVDRAPGVDMGDVGQRNALLDLVRMKAAAD